MLYDNKQFKKGRAYRVIVSLPTQGSFSCGTGFFVNKTIFVTCFHVAFSNNGGLKAIRNDPRFISSVGQDEHSKLKSYFQTCISKVEVELRAGLRANAILKDFDEKYDTAIFEVNVGDEKVNICHLDGKSTLSYGTRVSFFGFPTHYDYVVDKAPVAFQEGVLSAFVDTTIAGGKYEHLQVNSISLGGNSGAPIFLQNGNRVVGIINGNMNWGRDDLAIFGATGTQTSGASLMVPLSISYATSTKTLLEKTNISNELPKVRHHEWMRQVRDKMRAVVKKINAMRS